MSGGDGLRYGGHAHGVSTQGPGGPDLGGGLVLGAGEEHVYALPQGDGQLCRGLPGHSLKGRGVHMAHVREPGAEGVQIGTLQGTGAKELNVVGDEHNVPGGKGGVDGPGGVGDHQGLRAQQPQHPDRIGHVLEGPALVSVQAALHHSHILPRQTAKEKAAGVVRGGRALHVRNLFIGHGDGVLHRLSQASQAGAQNQQDLGAEGTQSGLQGRGALLVMGKGVFHGGSPYSFSPHSRQN